MSRKKEDPGTSAPEPWTAGLPRLGLILLLAAALRLTAIGWGIPGPSHGPFHPDELKGIRGIYSLYEDEHHLKTTYFISTKGAGYFYTGMAVVMVGDRLGLLPERMEDIGDNAALIRRLYLAIRAVTVLMSLGTVALVFLAGRRLFGPRAGELAALLESVSPISVINAHYIKTDCPEAFWVTLTMFLAVAATRDRRWLIAAVFTAGVAGAFKYPGVSAVIFPLAAAVWLRPDERRSRLRLALLSLPLVVVGFILFYPGAALDFKGFYTGLTSEAGRKVLSDWKIPLARIAAYPFRLMQADGIVLPLWAWGSMAFFLVRRRPETNFLLAWLLPYLALMSSSVVVLVRYAVPMMPVLALLMAAMAEELAALWPRRAGAVRAAALAAAGLITLVTFIHLRAMLRPDPRELGTAWVRANVPPRETVALTPSHKGDVFFTIMLDHSRHQKLELQFRADQDVAGYLIQPFNYLAANEQAWDDPAGRHPSQKLFWDIVNDPGRWTTLVRFNNRPSLPGPLLRGNLPEDMRYIYQEVRVYRRGGT